MWLRFIERRQMLTILAFIHDGSAGIHMRAFTYPVSPSIDAPFVLITRLRHSSATVVNTPRYFAETTPVGTSLPPTTTYSCGA